MFLFANNATSRLQVAIDPGTTVFLLVPGTGERFPDPEPYEMFAITLYDPDTGAREICYCAARDGDELIVDRAQEGTSAFPFPAGTQVAHQLTAGVLEALRDG